MRKSILDLTKDMFNVFVDKYGQKRILSKIEENSSVLTMQEKEYKKRGIQVFYFDDNRMPCGQKYKTLVCSFSPKPHILRKSGPPQKQESSLDEFVVEFRNSMYYRTESREEPFAILTKSRKTENIFFVFMFIQKTNETVFAFSATTTPIRKFATPPILFSVTCGYKQRKGIQKVYCKQSSRLFEVTSQYSKELVDIFVEIMREYTTRYYSGKYSTEPIIPLRVQIEETGKVLAL